MQLVKKKKIEFILSAEKPKIFIPLDTLHWLMSSLWKNEYPSPSSPSSLSHLVKTGMC